MGFDIKLRLVSMGVDLFLIGARIQLLGCVWLCFWLDGAQPRPCGLGVVMSWLVWEPSVTLGPLGFDVWLVWELKRDPWSVWF